MLNTATQRRGSSPRSVATMARLADQIATGKAATASNNTGATSNANAHAASPNMNGKATPTPRMAVAVTSSLVLRAISGETSIRALAILITFFMPFVVERIVRLMPVVYFDESVGYDH